MTGRSPTGADIPVLRFQDVVVSPYDAVPGNPPGPLTRGGPHWPDWQTQREARQCRHGTPCDAPPLLARPMSEITEPLLWGGPVVSHFGHQIAEFSMRLVPSVVAQPTRAIAFASHPDSGFRNLADLPGFVRDTLSWVGLPAERTRLIDQPTLIRDLAVCAQAEQLYGPGPSSEHLDLMDAFVAPRIARATQPRASGLYVSRAGQRTRVAGESYLEHLMTAAGLSVMRPEDVALSEQLLAYANADQVIFSEGSAMHGVRLLGRNLRDVVVIRRQAGPTIAEDAVTPRAISVSHVDAMSGRLFNILSDGRPAHTPAIAILDAGRLRHRLVSLMPRLERHWDTQAYETSRDADLLAWISWWLQDPIHQATIDRAATWASIQENLRRTGLAEVARAAEELAWQASRPAPRSAWSRLRRSLGTRRAESTLSALILQSQLFDEAWYLERYPDVTASGLDPVTHFLRTGADAGYDPGPDFDVGAYRAKYPDVVASCANPLVHYLRYGAAEGRVIQRAPEANRNE